MSAETRDGNNGIEVRGLVRDFKGGVRAVDGIDLSVAPGEIYGFLGPNGAGKSTTVLVLTTLLPPTAGTATVAGLDVAKQGPEVRRAIGASLQESALDPFLTGREHMRLQSSLHGIDRAETDRRGTELLARVGLTNAADRKVGGYSGGMKRRLDLALALVHRPRLLFLDEPTTGLDPQSRAALWEEVRRLAGEGVTVFLTTQYLEEADVLADRVGIIDKGKIVAEGTPAELKAAIGRPSVEAIPQDPGDTARLREVLAASARRPPPPRRASPHACRRASGTSPRSCARSTRRASRSRTFACTRRHSTTCSSRRPAARSRAARTRTATRRSRPATRCPREHEQQPVQPDQGTREALDPEDTAPAVPAVPDRLLPSDPARGQRERPEGRHATCRASRQTPTSPSRSPSRSSRERCSPSSTPARTSRRTSRTASSTASPSPRCGGCR